MALLDFTGILHKQKKISERKLNYFFKKKEQVYKMSQYMYMQKLTNFLLKLGSFLQYQEWPKQRLGKELVQLYGNNKASVMRFKTQNRLLCIRISCAQFCLCFKKSLHTYD